MQLNTRRYARRQRHWLVRRILPAPGLQVLHPYSPSVILKKPYTHLTPSQAIRVASDNLAQWHQDVHIPAMAAISHVLAGGTLPHIDERYLGPLDPSKMVAPKIHKHAPLISDAPIVPADTVAIPDVQLSGTTVPVLTSISSFDAHITDWRKHTCDVCTRTFNGDHEWDGMLTLFTSPLYTLIHKVLLPCAPSSFILFSLYLAIFFALP